MVLLMVAVNGAIYGRYRLPSEPAALGVMEALIIVLFQLILIFKPLNRSFSGLNSWPPRTCRAKWSWASSFTPCW